MIKNGELKRRVEVVAVGAQGLAEALLRPVLVATDVQFKSSKVRKHRRVGAAELHRAAKQRLCVVCAFSV
jgi:hypothetical protein